MSDNNGKVKYAVHNARELVLCQTIWRGLKVVFCRLRLNRLAKESLRCLDFPRYRFSCRQAYKMIPLPLVCMHIRYCIIIILSVVIQWASHIHAPSQWYVCMMMSLVTNCLHSTFYTVGCVWLLNLLINLTSYFICV